MKLILQSTLRSLGITEKYAGFSLAVTAISLCFERPSRLRSVTKEGDRGAARMQPVRCGAKHPYRDPPRLESQPAGAPGLVRIPFARAALCL